MRIDRALACTVLCLGVGAAPALAAPLDPETCAAFKTEYQGLIAAGVKADMDRGPEWAKANLTPDRLGRIERLIAVGEQLSFRCGEQVTAQPAMKELPKPVVAVTGKGAPSNIPLPKRKDADAARKHAARN